MILSTIPLLAFFLTANAEISCRDEARCNPAIGALLRPGKVCTSFLFYDDVLVTNSHCVEPLTAGQSCGDMRVIFPKQKNLPEAQASCERILETSPARKFPLQPDYAFLKLKTKVKREPLQIQRVGFQAGKAYTVWSVLYTGKNAEVISENCEVIFDSFNNPFGQTGQSSLFILKSCPLVRGNSGSPVLNASNQVVGVISLAKDPKQMSSPMGVGFNFYCLVASSLGFKGPLPGTCEQDFSESRREKLAEEMHQRIFGPVLKKTQEDIQRKVASLKMPSEFDYLIEPKDQKTQGAQVRVQHTFEIRPKCLIKGNVREKNFDRTVNASKWTITEIYDENGVLKVSSDERPVGYLYQFQTAGESHRLKLTEVGREHESQTLQFSATQAESFCNETNRERTRRISSP